MGFERDGFAAGEAARLSGVPYRTLDFWAKSDFLGPSVLPASGTGSRRLYSFGDLVALRVARYLRGAGISLQSLRRVVAYLRRRNPATSFADCFLVTDGVDVYEVQGDMAVSALLQPGQIALACVVDLGRLVADLRRAVTEKA